jgi:hypothetical protein
LLWRRVCDGFGVGSDVGRIGVKNEVVEEVVVEYLTEAIVGGR